MRSERVVIKAKQVAQECAMKASYHRREFTRDAWRQTIVAALLIPLGLILFLRVPAAGFILFVCGAVAAHGAYSSFQTPVQPTANTTICPKIVIISEVVSTVLP